jgi:hypothetical protein
VRRRRSAKALNASQGSAEFADSTDFSHIQSLVPGVAVLIITYVVGQTVAHFSSFFLEQIVVHRMLKRPSSLLMGAKPSLKPFKWLFPNYHRALAPATQESVRRQATARGCSAEDEGLFQHAYPVVTAEERAQARLDDFRNQYGFARNMAFAFVVAATSIAVAYRFGHQPVRLRWAALALLAGITMFYRYLKFFRQFSYELFLRYAALPLPGSQDHGDERLKDSRRER